MAQLARVEVFTADEIAIVHVINRTLRRHPIDPDVEPHDTADSFQEPDHLHSAHPGRDVRRCG